MIGFIRTSGSISLPEGGHSHAALYFCQVGEIVVTFG
jgi:hypothetical protein